MSSLADVVYAITPAGYAELRNTEKPMHLQLRTVLTLIDGVCPVAQYTPFLKAFEPLREKFLVLERIGCIRRTGTISEQAISRFEQSVAQGFSVSQLPRIDSEFQESGFVAMP